MRFALALPFNLGRLRRQPKVFAEVMGFLPLPVLKGSIWVQVMSVGELRAVERLLELLRQEFPDKCIVVSTAIPVDQRLARGWSMVDYVFCFPVDLPGCVRRTLNRVDPDLVILTESEMWPNFLRLCRDRGVPVALVNGIVRDDIFARSTSSRYRFHRRWTRKVLQGYAIMAMQSESDRIRIEDMGADPQKVLVFGNLKYDGPQTNNEMASELVLLFRSWQQVWVVASTAPGEEKPILAAYGHLVAAFPQLKLIIAPRDPQRFDEVHKLAQEPGFAVIRRTEINNPSGPHLDYSTAQILILDSIGELAALLRYASVVFVAGSLLQRGGHNILEPARYGKPIVFGPHMENFHDLAQLFLESDAALQVKDVEELTSSITALLLDRDKATKMGQNARAIIDQNTGVTERVLQALRPIVRQIS